MMAGNDCGVSTSHSVWEQDGDTYRSSFSSQSTMVHKSGNGINNGLNVEMMLGEDYGRDSTSSSLPQLGGNSCHTSLADANTMVQKYGSPIIIGVDHDSSLNITDTENLGSANKQGCSAEIEAPRVGMVFGSWEEIDVYYRQYGKNQGFGVVRASSAQFEKNKGQRRNMTWKCECAGKRDMRQRLLRNGSFLRERRGNDVSEGEITSVLRVDNPRRSKKCECGAMIYAKSMPDGNWLLNKVILEHTNHNPNPSKWRDRDLKGRKLAKTEAGLNLMLSQTHNYMEIEKGGFDHINTGRGMIDEEKGLKFTNGDANAILRFFMRMHQSSLNFFHFSRHDDSGYLKDMLWVDSRSRVAYEEFNDVIYFDTTYLTSEYNLPLVNLIGINHHGQTILLGCALVSHEGLETFEWVFRTWLLCMGDRAPQAILTDRVPTIRKALAETMPETRHTWCVWHIVQMFPKKLGLLPRYQEFNKDLKYAVCNSYTAEDFERHWTAVIAEYQLQENEWLRCLFEERHMWVPAYTKNMFLAGFRPARRVERIQSYFDGFVEKQTKLCDFVEGYCFAMGKKVNMEEDADEECAHYARGLATGFIVESFFQKIYTDAKFREVQIECQGLLYCRNHGRKTVSETEVEHVIEDRVWAEVPGSSKSIPTSERRSYRVSYNNVTNEVSCECNLFEFSGIMCRHSIIVYDFYDVSIIPKKYILRRWRKDIRRKHTRIKVAYHDPLSTQEVKRYHKMHMAFEDVSSEAMGCDKAHEIVLKLIAEMKSRVAECLGKQSVDSLVELNDLVPNETMSYVGNTSESNDLETLAPNGSRSLDDKKEQQEVFTSLFSER